MLQICDQPDRTPSTGVFDRRRTILAAARQEFLKHGFQAAKIRSIVTRSGSSSKTIYSLFGSKHALFREVIDKSMEDDFDKYLTVGFGDGPIRDELLSFGLMYAKVFTDPDTVSFFRMIVAECEVLPEECKFAWEHGPGRVEKNLQAYFEKMNLQGHLDLPSPRYAAMQFKEMVLSGMHIRMMVAGIVPSDSEIEKSINTALDLFFQGVGVRSDYRNAHRTV